MSGITVLSLVSVVFLLFCGSYFWRFLRTSRACSNCGEKYTSEPNCFTSEGSLFEGNGSFFLCMSGYNTASNDEKNLLSFSPTPLQDVDPEDMA